MRGDDSGRIKLAGLNPDDADYQEKLNALAEQKAERAKARFLKMAEVREKISDILTEEQLEKFDEMAQKQGKRGKKHHRHS